jgi:GNAT superfamily N-acetyltransferase
MSIQIVPVAPGHVAELGRICFEAFGALQDRHGVERDFDSVETATMLVGMFASRADFAGFAAVEDRKVVGSNFLGFSDPVAGVGPITIRPEAQSTGVGRLLMIAVMDEARRRGVHQVRLQQESINTVSLSLYTKLGFDWRESCALMKLAPAAADHPLVRPATLDDLPEIDRVSTKHYHATRKNEAAWMLKAGMPGFVIRNPGGRVSGYYLPGFIGHGFAETADMLAALMLHAARHSPAPFLRALVPLGEAELHRALLRGGCRTVKLFNYMTTGAYERPRSAWVPSIGM